MRKSEWKTMARGRIGLILVILGLFLFRMGINYILFTEKCELAKEQVETAEYGCVEIAGMIAVAEGTVTRAEDDWTKIAYFHYWDGAVYNKIIPYKNPDYPVNAKVIVVCLPGFGPGNCLVSGFYRNRFLMCGVVGLLMSITGVIILKNNGKRMENKKNGKKENCSRKLENEHDAQSGGCSVQ